MKEIDHLMENLKQDDIALHKEGTAEGYLEMDIHHQGSKTTLLQVGLAKRIITTLGLDSKYSAPVNHQLRLQLLHATSMARK
jgi:hypothetical protein